MFGEITSQATSMFRPFQPSSFQRRMISMFCSSSEFVMRPSPSSGTIGPRIGRLALGKHLDDLPSEEVAMATRPPCHKIAVDDHVLVGVNGSHVLDVTMQVVVRDHLAAAD